MKSLQPHPIILLPGCIIFFQWQGRGERIWYESRRNYKIITMFWKHIINQLFIAWISLLLFLDANRLQVSIRKITDFKKSKRRTQLLRWSHCMKLYKSLCGILSSIQMPKHLLENFWLPSATCFIKGEQQQKEMEAKAESLRVITFNKWKFS